LTKHQFIIVNINTVSVKATFNT